MVIMTTILQFMSLMLDVEASQFYATFMLSHL